MGVDMTMIIEYRVRMDGEWLVWAEIEDEPRFYHWKDYVEPRGVWIEDEWYATDLWSIDEDIAAAPPDPEDWDAPRTRPEYVAMQALAKVYGPNNVRLKWRLT